MHISKSGILALMLCAAATVANASIETFVDIDKLNMKLSANSDHGTMTAVLDVTAKGIEGDAIRIGRYGPTIHDKGGFDPLAHTANDATLKVWLYDDEYMDPREYALVGIPGHKFPAEPYEYEVVTIRDGDVNAEITAQLNENGQVKYGVKALEGDFYAAYAAVKVEAETSAAPEPTTMAVWSLLGALGLAAGWRRRRKAT